MWDIPILIVAYVLVWAPNRASGLSIAGLSWFKPEGGGLSFNYFEFGDLG